MWALGLLFLATREPAPSPDLATGLVGGQICSLFCCYQFQYKKLMIANFQHVNANRIQSKVHNKIVRIFYAGCPNKIIIHTLLHMNWPKHPKTLLQHIHGSKATVNEQHLLLHPLVACYIRKRPSIGSM
jgi:hypothetical protein